MSDVTGSQLSADDLEFYRRNGYLVHDRLFNQDDFAALCDHFDGLLAALPEGARPEHMDVPHFADPELFRWLLAPDVLDLVEQLIGPDIALFSAHFLCKPAGDGESVPWHEDAHFWQESITPASAAITVWLALDPSTTDNGCMRVIPGSHDARARRYRAVADQANFFDRELDPTEIDPARSVPIELAPNQCSIHAATLVHGSEANTSAQRRCGLTMRYISTAVRFHHERVGDRHQIYLARGTDHAGNVYADPTVVNTELLSRRGNNEQTPQQ